MIVGEHAFRARIVIDSVRSLADVDLIDELQGRWIEHRNFVLAAVARKPVLELRSDRDAMNARGIGDGADERAVVGIDYVHLGTVREIQAPRVAIDCYVVEAAIAGYGIASLDFISCTLPHREDHQRANDCS